MPDIGRTDVKVEIFIWMKQFFQSYIFFLFFSENCFGLPNNGTKYKPWFVPGGKTTKRPKVSNPKLEITVIKVEDIKDMTSAVPMKDPNSNGSSDLKINVYFIFLLITLLILIVE